MAIDPSRTNEVFAILQKGEIVSQPDQIANIMRNNRTLGMVKGFAEGASVSNVKNAQNQVVNVNFTGGITMNEVQDVEKFTSELFRNAKPVISQTFSKVF